MVNHPPLGLVGVFAAAIPTLSFAPGIHVNYAEAVLPMCDGLPKLKDFPTQFGGTGEVIAEMPASETPKTPELAIAASACRGAAAT
jgi:hypothetical protein